MKQRIRSLLDRGMRKFMAYAPSTCPAEIEATDIGSLQRTGDASG